MAPDQESTEITVSTEQDSAAVTDLIQALNETVTEGEGVSGVGVTITSGGERPIETPGETRGLGVVEFFLLIAGIAWLVNLVKDVVKYITQNGGTVIDGSAGGKPVISADPSLPDGSVVIITKDGKVEFKAEQTTFEALIDILKAVLVGMLSGKNDTAKDVEETVKDAIASKKVTGTVTVKTPNT